jgi:peptidoglycan/xylan/chitin deacetylase (PgdA/CDA1 family)
VSILSPLRRVNRIARQAWRRIFPGALILFYHRVADIASDPFEQAVSVRNFEEQLQFLHRHAAPCSLTDMIEYSRKGRIPARSVAVTVDDGYVDSLYAVKPLLERYNIPATFFVCGGLIGSSMEFWWDELERLLLMPGTLQGGCPDHLKPFVSADQWEAGRDYTFEESKLYTNWKFFDQIDPTPRHTLLRIIHARFRQLHRNEQTGLLHKLRDCCRNQLPVRSSYIPLKEQELVHLAKGKSVEIGGHTLFHASLSSLTSVEQQNEILEGNRRLEQIINREVRLFSYPFGDFCAETIELVRNTKLLAACTTQARPVRAKENIYALPRLWPRNWNGDEFGFHLRHWLRG